MNRYGFFSLAVGTLVCLTFTSCMPRTKHFGGEKIAQASEEQTSNQSNSQRKVGDLELVAELDITPGNITVSRDGRIFASVHGMRRGSAQLIEIFPNSDSWQFS